jgi:hypothetical protein
MLHMAQHILMLARMAAMEVDEDALHGGGWQQSALLLVQDSD